MAPPYTGIVKLKATNFIKSSALIVWIMYFLVSNSNCGVRLPISLSHGMQIYLLDKQYLLSKSCLSLLGGSNVVMGLSANKLSTVSCRAINLGIYREGDGFQNYTKWLSDGLRVGPAIYSPAVIWSDSHALQIEEASINYLKIPDLPILSQIKALFTFDENLTFDEFGDINRYICHSYFRPFKIDKKRFTEGNDSIVKEIKHRVVELKKITGSGNLYVRVPPIYANEKDLTRYRELINGRVDLLKAAGISIIGETTVSSDRSLFCDNFHPNQKGRDIFTNEIELQSHK